MEHGDDTIFESDLTVGQYVEDLCHTANSVCSGPEQGTDVVVHTRL
jgi:hypothetical protein